MPLPAACAERVAGPVPGDVVAAQFRHPPLPHIAQRVLPELAERLSALKVFFARDEPIMGIGPSPEAAARAFDLKIGDVSPGVRASRGFAFLTPIAKQDPYVPKLDEVKDRVREEVIKIKARDLAKQKAAEVAPKRTADLIAKLVAAPAAAEKSPN